MKAVALVEPGRVELIEKASPVLEDEYGALLRPLIVAPCTSDVHTIFHGGSKKKDNLIMGHESVCQVIAIGKNVKDFKVGDVVAVPAITPSWDSLDIQDGNLMHAGAPFSGHKLGRTIDGVFAERVYLPFADLNLAHIPEGVSAEQALMTVDVVSTGFTAVEEAEVSFGDNVVVFGIGAIGLAAVIGAKLSGAARIIVVGTKKVSVELAMQYGATDVINYKIGDVVEQIRRLGIRIDKAIICGGDDNTLRQAYDIVKYGTGVVSNVMMFTGTGDMPIPKFSGGKGMCGKTFKMSLCKGGRARIERLMNMIAVGRFDPTKLITHKFYGMDKIIAGLYQMKDSKENTIKVAVQIK